MKTVYLIISEDDAGAFVSAYASEAARDAAYIELLGDEYGETFANAQEAWEYMDAQLDDWSCYTSSAPVEGELQ